ncbi:MAG: hypothetical protein IKF82_00720 [Bacilli bacterium]|nr:hypothetical protein [Bacilli bacterium]
MMQNIIQKRTDLINFFLNENNEYSYKDILHKEFAVLSFSPHDEYIDSISSEYDYLCVDLSTFTFNNCDEIYIKGIIVDIDRQKDKTIIHVQNKESIVSVFCYGAPLDKYHDFFVVGEPIIAKCSIYNERLSLSFLVNLNDLEQFNNECRYMSGESFKVVDDIMATNKHKKIHYGVIVQCKQIKTKKDKDMIIGSLYDGEKIRNFGTVKTYYNKVIPVAATAGAFVKFIRPTSDFFLNSMEVVEL